MSLSIKGMLASATLTSLMVSSTVNAAEEQPLTVYGKMNVSLQQNDSQVIIISNNQLIEQSVKKTSVSSNGSRIGLKGKYELGHNIDAFYKIEYKVDSSSASRNNFEARNQYVGLAGDFGSIALGRNDTVLKISKGGIDLFKNLPGDNSKLFYGENRFAQTATYYTPNLNDFRLGVTYVAESDPAQIKIAESKNANTNAKTVKGESGISIGAMFGDQTFKKVPLYISIAYDTKVLGNNIVRVSAQGKFSDITLGAMYQQQEKDDNNSETYNGYLISAAYNVRNVDFKVQYQYIDGGLQSVATPSNQTTSAKSFSVGTDYYLAKPTKVFVYYTGLDYDDLTNNDQFFGVGVQHSF